jgi:putative peptidoglycan lipid II flippase
LALSISSAINTAYLFVSLFRSGIPGVREELLGAARYFLRILVFSLVAALPLYFLRPFVVSLFADSSSRFVYAGLPLVLETLVFALIGIACLLISRDRVALSFVSRFIRRRVRE